MMAARQSDLAARLGLTQGTVSRALRGHVGVSPEVRQRVLEMAREIGYQPRTEAATAGEALIPRRTGVMCVDIPRADEWHERLLDGIVAGAGETGHEILTSVHSRGELPQVVMRGQVDGLIRLMSQDDYWARLGPVPEAPVPTVSILYPVPGADQVSVDHFGSARALGLHVASLGHRQAAYIGHVDPIGRARAAGFRSGIEECGGTVPPELLRFVKAIDPEAACAQLDELLALRAGGRPEHQFAVVGFYNDFLARHAIEHLRGCGLRIPEDIGVVGYDDLELPIARDIRLTTVHLPLEELGVEAVRRIHWRLTNPAAPPLHWLLETKVVKGDSAGGVMA